MRVARVRHEGQERLALQSVTGLHLLPAGLGLTDLMAPEGDAVARAVHERSQDPEGRPGLAPGDVDLLLPWRPGTIIGIGLNYRDMVRAMGLAEPAEPYLFPKLSSSVLADGAPLALDGALTQRADWEGELGVVLGRRSRHVRQEDALDGVYGYVAANDISARDLQARDGQWLRGKGLDGFCPLGQVVVTRDEVPDPQALRIRTWVDGELQQDGSTADMIFGVAELIAYCTAAFTLEPGDLVLTGTPAGCGEYQDPPRHLRPGALVKVDVEGVGGVRTPVVDAPVS